MPTPRTSRPPTAESIETVHTAVTALGTATAAEIATRAGLAYSAVTPRLRALADAGRIEFFHGDDGKGRWHPTQPISEATTADQNPPDASPTADIDTTPAPTTADTETTAHTETTEHPESTARPPRRPSKGLITEVEALLQAAPDTEFRVGEIAKRLGGASTGAIANALYKLVVRGAADQTVEAPATFRAHRPHRP